MNRIKILFVHHFTGLGGATLSLYYIIERLDPDLYEVEVLFAGREGDGIDFFRSKGIKVRTSDQIILYPHSEGAKLSLISRRPLEPVTRFFRLFASVKFMVQFFKTHHYDLVHINTTSLLVVGKAAKLAGTKVIWHIREPLFKGVFGLRKKIVAKWIHRYADIIIAISKFEASRIGASSKLIVISNYIDLNKFDYTLSGRSIRKELGLGEDDFVLANLGGTLHSKGGDCYAEAAGMLSARYPQFKFLLVGYASESATTRFPLKRWLKEVLHLKQDRGFEIRKTVEKKKLHNSLIITGMRSDIPYILAASDALAWTASVPHFARPIFEAGAMSKPVVASRFESTLEALVDGWNGLLFEPKCPKDLAEKIEYLFLNPERAEEMGRNGLRLAREKFNADENFRSIEACYKRLIQQ